MCAAPKGNQFWKLRSTHGRDTLFASSQLMLETAFEYFQWCDKHPWYKHEAIKSGESSGKTVRVPTQRPYSLSGLMLYFGASEAYFRTFKLTNTNEDFLSVIARIEEIISTQQLDGALVGAFNANIVSRKLGLVDKQDISSGGEPINVTIVRNKDDDDE